MKISYWAVILAIYITYFFTDAVGNVGMVSESIEYPWFLPWEVLIFLMVPAIFGYLIAKDSD